MFIPKTPDNLFQVGDIVILNKNIELGFGIFTIGHVCTVINLNNSYSTIIVSDNKYKHEFKIDSDNISPMISFNKCKKKYLNEKKDKKIIKLIEKYCPHCCTDYDYSDREEYNKCSIDKHGFYGKRCMVEYDCINFLDINDIKKEKLLIGYYRKMKIKKIKNAI